MHVPHETAVMRAVQVHGDSPQTAIPVAEGHDHDVIRNVAARLQRAVTARIIIRDRLPGVKSLLVHDLKDRWLTGRRI